MDIIGILVLVISFFFLLVVGVPVAYSIGVAGILTMLVNIDSLPALTTYAMRMASGLDVSLCWRSRFLYWRGIS